MTEGGAPLTEPTFYDRADLATLDAKPGRHPDHLDADQWAGLRRYVRQLADLLALRDWTIYLEHESCDDDAEAETFVLDNRRVATIKVCREFAQLPAHVRRHTLAHELLHLPLHRPWLVLGNDLDRFLSSGEQAIAKRVYEREVEFAADGLSDGIAPLLPLPDI